MLQEEKEAFGDAKRSITQDGQEKMRKISSEADHFRDFFNGKVVAHSDFNNNNNNNSTDNNKGFQDNKRRVPSCPDPLHN